MGFCLFTYRGLDLIELMMEKLIYKKVKVRGIYSVYSYSIFLKMDGTADCIRRFYYMYVNIELSFR